MDLLFVRYASPFVLLDGLIMTNSLNSFVDDFFDFVKEKSQWEFFLHKVYDKTWKEFINEIKTSNEQKDRIYILSFIHLLHYHLLDGL